MDMYRDFSLSIRHNGMASTLSCSGELDGANSSKLREAIEMALETQPTILEFDGTRLTFIDGRGIEALLRLAGECVRRGIVARISCSPPVSALLDKMGLSWLEGANELLVHAGDGDMRMTYSLHSEGNGRKAVSGRSDGHS
jgi:anti-anti-sigma factor